MQKSQGYITQKGLQQSITNRINILERLSLYKAWKDYVQRKHVEHWKKNVIKTWEQQKLERDNIIQ